MSERFDLLELATGGGLPHERAIAVIAAFTDRASAEAVHWSLPACDARLLELYRERYGSQLRAVSACPQCGGVLDLRFAVEDLLAALTQTDLELELNVAGYELRLRLPTVADLAAAQRADDLEGARELIAAQCICTCTHEGVEVAVGAVPPAVLDAVEQRLERFDLGGDGLELSCPDCLTEWSATLDVTTLVLAELDAEGQQLLADVHLLARAYGWSEAEIVALSPERRRKYVELVLG